MVRTLTPDAPIPDTEVAVDVDVAEPTPLHPEPAAAEPTSVADELAAMKRIVSALDGLDQAARRRALYWLTDRYTNHDQAE